MDEDTGGNATRKRGRERVNPATGNEATLSVQRAHRARDDPNETKIEVRMIMIL